MNGALGAALAPSSIAVVGASDDRSKIGGIVVSYLDRYGFTGEIIPVNPRRDTIQGHRAVATLRGLGREVDLAFIAVPEAATLDAVRDCAAAGVKTAIVTASGFRETGETGARAERELLIAARTGGMRLIGPNSQGLANFRIGAAANFSSLFPITPPADGPVAIVSQSGSMSIVPYCALRERGIGVRYCIATGNEVDVSGAELAESILGDADIRLVLLYMENISDAGALARVGALARERNVPVLALKAGRTDEGNRAALAHTGALAGEDRAVAAFFERHGIQRATGLRDLVDHAELYLHGARPAGRRLMIVTDSGATAVMASDAAARHGLVLAEPSDGACAKIAAAMPGFAVAGNPIDMTSALRTTEDMLERVLGMLAEDDCADLFLVGFPTSGAGYPTERFARDVAGFAERTGKPIAMMISQPQVAVPFRAAGLPIYRDEDEAVAGLARIAEHAALLRRPKLVHWPLGDAPRLPGGAGALSEAQSLEIVSARGITVVEHRVCQTLDGAREAFASFGSPVVLKCCSSRVAHKWAAGLVVLGIEAIPALDAAWHDIVCRAHALGIDTPELIIAREVRGAHELLIGARYDDAIGPVVVIGAGGVETEAVDDTTVLCPPFSRDDVIAQIRTLRCHAMLVSGRVPIGLDRFADVALSLAHLVRDAAGRISAVDLNPVLLDANGTAIAVDALVELSAEPDNTRDNT